MPTIKNVAGHPDDLHDGGAIAAYATATISDEALANEHYQQRIAAGVFVVAQQDPGDPDPLVLDDEQLAAWVQSHTREQVLDAAKDSPASAGRLLAAEQTADKPRSTLIDALGPLAGGPTDPEVTQ